jgi:hypothetical protein
MSDISTADLITEVNAWLSESPDDPDTEEVSVNVVGLIARLRDALQAVTVPTENERELAFRIADTLAYYRCRSNNPKADHPHMGYHAFSEDQREHLRGEQAEATGEILRIIAERAKRIPVAVEENKPRKFTPEQRAELIDFARSAIQSVWDDVGATTAEVLAGNVVSAQEFAWLSMHFPVAVPVEPEWEYRRRIERCGSQPDAIFEAMPVLDDGFWAQRRTVGEWEDVPPDEVTEGGAAGSRLSVPEPTTDTKGTP